MKIKFDFTRRQERPLIVGFQAEGQRYVELQEDTTTPSLLETIAHIAGATVDGLVAQGVGEGSAKVTLAGGHAPSASDYS
ncbi:hypothetical protein MTO96_051132 [Rhipicephalus appendiculatus]